MPYDVPMKDLRRSLEARILALGRVAVAFSGGVDSGLVLALARRVRPDVLALTADSPALARAELAGARRICAALGVGHGVIATAETEAPGYRANAPSRCYHCKQSIYVTLGDAAREAGCEALLDGSTGEDLGERLRPGLAAGRELGVVSPLAEHGLGKAEVRRLARRLGLSIWGKPAFACLASRFPFGVEVTPPGMARVEAAEAVLRALGFHAFRVRDHRPIARVELPPAELGRALAPRVRRRIVDGLRAAGFTYVTLDLEGLRSGSLEALLPGT